MAAVVAAVPAVDATLEGAAKSTLGKLQHDLATLRGKVISAAKKRDETLRRQFFRAQAQAFPDGIPQERALGQRRPAQPLRPGARPKAGAGTAARSRPPLGADAVMPKPRSRRRPATRRPVRAAARPRAALARPYPRATKYTAIVAGVALCHRLRADRLLLRVALAHDRRAPARRARSRAAACLRAAAGDSPKRRPLREGSHRSAERPRLRTADAGAEARRVRRQRALGHGHPARRQPHGQAADDQLSAAGPSAPPRARSGRSPRQHAYRSAVGRASSRSRASRSMRRC